MCSSFSPKVVTANDLIGGDVVCLRAKGHVIADQYAMARRSGFDEIEIDNALAARQPEAQWVYRANWRDHDYQTLLRAKNLSIVS